MSVLIDMDMPKNCVECLLEDGSYCLVRGEPVEAIDRPKWCPLHEDESDIPIFDKETRIENCTVQILENTETGRISVGWWRNEDRET